MEDRRTKKGGHWEGIQKRLREEFVVGGLMTQRGLCNIAKKRMLEERETFCTKMRAISCVNMELCLKFCVSAISIGRMWNEEQRKW